MILPGTSGSISTNPICQASVCRYIVFLKCASVALKLFYEYYMTICYDMFHNFCFLILEKKKEIQMRLQTYELGTLPIWALVLWCGVDRQIGTVRFALY